MKRQHPHVHPCPDCETPVECAGGYEYNHDGLSDTYCPIYERHNEQPCDSCQAEREHDAAKQKQLAECGPDYGEAWSGGFAENH